MSSESSYSFTAKIGGTNDLFTVRGDTFEEFLSNLVSASTIPSVKYVVDILSGEVPTVETVAASLGGVTVGGGVPAPAFSAAMPAAVVTPMATSTQQNNGNGRACSHGQMTAKQGVGKDGKVWRGYMCPAPAGAADKCKNQYIYPNQPEWHTFVAS